MNQFLSRAHELTPEYENIRQTIHRFGGCAFDVRQSADLIIAELQKIGIPFREISPCTIEALIGKGGKTILLRADFDALPFDEDSGLPYAAENGTCHACGHDFHASMLLCAAKMLKEKEAELPGTVKLLFQPAEEICSGAKAAIEGGILSNPNVDAAFSLHVAVGSDTSALGHLLCSKGAAFAAAQAITLHVYGKGGHGSAPEDAVDPNMMLCRILLAFEHMLASEKPSDQCLVLTFGRIAGGSSGNTIPDTAEAHGSMRALDLNTLAFAKQRMVAIADGIASAMRGKAEVIFHDNSPDLPVINDADMVDQIKPFFVDVLGESNTTVQDKPYWLGSEDFCFISDKVPAVMGYLGAGSIEEGYSEGLHSPRVKFSPDVLPIGAALHANVAYNWLLTNV